MPAPPRLSWNGGLVVGALSAQIALAAVLQPVRPHRDVLPPPPAERALAAAAFGDLAFLYRRLALDLQNFGDTGGRITPLRDYDMARVVAWLRALDTLDPAAQHHLVLAARYFAGTQDTPQLIHLIRYIQQLVAKDPHRGLQWLPEAILMARKLGDRAVMLDLADQLAGYDFPGMTLVAYQLPAILHEKEGEFEKAAAYMERALRLTAHRASAQETTFMRDFIAATRRRATVELDGPATATSP